VCEKFYACYTGELGWELHVPAESCVAVYLALMEEGRDLGLVNAGYRAIDSLSMEKVSGIFYYRTMICIFAYLLLLASQPFLTSLLLLAFFLLLASMLLPTSLLLLASLFLLHNIPAVAGNPVVTNTISLLSLSFLVSSLLHASLLLRIPTIASLPILVVLVPEIYAESVTVPGVPSCPDFFMCCRRPYSIFDLPTIAVTFFCALQLLFVLFLLFLKLLASPRFLVFPLLLASL
jgi:hypothetical protein